MLRLIDTSLAPRRHGRINQDFTKELKPEKKQYRNDFLFPVD